MTTTPALSPQPPARSGDRSLAQVRELHTRWRKTVRGVLKMSRRPESSTWVRWNAIRYVDTTLSMQFNRERAAVDRVFEKLDERQRLRLWAAAELVASLGWQLDHILGACQHAAEFGALTLKLEAAIEHWCREVEEALGELKCGDLPAAVELALTERDGSKEATHVVHS